MLTGSAITRAFVIVVLAAGLAGIWQSLTGRLAASDPLSQPPRVVASAAAPSPPAVPQPTASPGDDPDPVRLVYPGPDGGEARSRPPVPDPVAPVTEARADPAPPASPPVFPPPVAAAEPEPMPDAGPPPEEPSQAAAPAASGIDLNTATLAELNGLRGGGLIGKAIIARRPYGSPQELVSKRVLSRAAFERIKDQVTVR
ncbi:helix-hairpin-helix domain-containing protein [Methylobacterium nodulans]|uniref:Helix-hairpin-helix motif protein n=1 Tax=Methylobacterium nodulans (strain LMG 21967 / CNCM I-2342 / ORS 2060) TaxID=460265 RepID=B8ICX2_METNO|nr:helix-hairpin-helix domain-containing protein [Methylobacterium nodulans]ACL59364.1 conserved hypothetical protein [Methylobacterium nodulans ORS 2060]